MRAVPKKGLAEHVEPRLSDASIERMWAGIEDGSRSSAAASRWWLVAAATLLVGMAAVVIMRPWSQQSVHPAVAQPEPPAGRSEVWLATGAQGKTHPLGDGSRLELAPATQVRVDYVGANDVRLRLERGRIDCHVPAAGGRRVVVHAGPAEMVTTLAQFHVELEMRPEGGPVLRVGVETGRVEVQREVSGEHLAALASGQTWSNAKLSDDEPAPVAQRPPPTSPGPAKSPVPTATARAGANEPAELLAAASRHRRAGDHAGAAADYERLRREHPGDARAGLAAFELARIRLEQLADAPGALEAFDAALASGKGGFFVEDAAAGRVRALSKLGDVQRCSRARAAFTRAHPKSPHAAELRKLCRAP